MTAEYEVSVYLEEITESMGMIDPMVRNKHIIKLESQIREKRIINI